MARGSRRSSLQTLDAATRDDSIDINIDLTPSFAQIALASVEIAPELDERDDATPLPLPYVEHDDEPWIDVIRTRPAEHASWDRTSHIRQRLAPLPLVKLGIAAILVGGLSAMIVVMLRGGDRASAAVQSRPVDPPPPQPQLSVAPLAEPAPVATTVETPTTTRQLTITSEPAGATVTVIDNGAAAIAGETPLSITIDTARSYDIVLTLAGYRTQLTRIDQRTNELAVALSASSTPQDTSLDRESRRRTEKRTAAATNTGEGTLMVSSKPPCEIAIDGVATMLTTPQRAIKLPPGKHKVTLFNGSHNIDATFEVVVDARKPTKLIRDFMPAEP